MAHLRKRYLQDTLKKTLAVSPLVGILGHRQVGKTTLLEQVSDTYLSFDNPSIDSKVRQNVTQFLKSLPMAGLKALDECQEHEQLFRALKEWERTNKRPGQFLLSGSIRFTSKKAIRESLTGRIMYHELYPMLLSEIRNETLPNTIIRMIQTESFRGINSLPLLKEISTSKRADYEKYLTHGGLPGVAFLRNETLRASKMEDQLATILDRDLRKIYQTTLPYYDIRRVLVELSTNQGSVIDWTELSRRTDLSSPTLKKLVFAFENLFLLRIIRVEGGRKGYVLYFEDMAERSVICDKIATTNIDNRKSLISHFLFTQLRGQLAYSLSGHFEYFQYLTKSGAKVPLAVRTKDGVLGLLPISDEAPDLSERRAADSFLKHYSNSKVFFLFPKILKQINDRLAVIDPLCLV